MIKRLLNLAVIGWGTGYAIIQVPGIWKYLAWLVPLLFLPILIVYGVWRVCKAPGNLPTDRL